LQLFEICEGHLIKQLKLLSDNKIHSNVGNLKLSSGIFYVFYGGSTKFEMKSYVLWTV